MNIYALCTQVKQYYEFFCRTIGRPELVRLDAGHTVCGVAVPEAFHTPPLDCGWPGDAAGHSVHFICHGIRSGCFQLWYVSSIEFICFCVCVCLCGGIYLSCVPDVLVPILICFILRTLRRHRIRHRSFHGA